MGLLSPLALSWSSPDFLASSFLTCCSDCSALVISMFSLVWTESSRHKEPMWLGCPDLYEHLLPQSREGSWIIPTRLTGGGQHPIPSPSPEGVSVFPE